MGVVYCLLGGDDGAEQRAVPRRIQSGKTNQESRQASSPQHVALGARHAERDSQRSMIASRPGIHGRAWYSTAIVFDEAYDFLQELAMLDMPNRAKGDSTSASGPTPNSGWWNRFLQCGKSDHEAKTAGCHGGQTPRQ